MYPQFVDTDFIHEFFLACSNGLRFALGIAGDERVAGGLRNLVMRKVRSLFYLQLGLCFVEMRYASHELQAANL